jgi:pyruvate carboxylase subunit B
MRYRVVIAGHTVEVELGPAGVRVDGEPVTAELQAVPDGPVRSLLIDGASHRLVAHRSEPGRWELRLRGWRLAAEVVDERTLRIREMTGASVAAAGPKPVRAPMPGLVVRVEVAEGDEVKPGQGLVIVEAMKMENELRAEVAGRVKAIHVQAGEAVEKDQVLIDLAGPQAKPGAAAEG